MADVQLEHGHLRIANALDEAITFASFTGAQTKIVRCLVRLTFGWRRRTVRIALPDLAERCNLAMTGGFRRALDALIREGVVFEVEKPYGRTPALYAINKDFESWGKLSVAAKALEALFGERPASGDPDPAVAPRVPPQGQSTDAGDDYDEPGCMPPQGAMTAPTGHDDRPHGGTETGPKSLIDETVQPRKDNEIQERQSITIRAGAGADGPKPENLSPAMRLVIAANQGLRDHPTRPQPIPRILVGQPGTLEALEVITAAQVPIEFAERAVYAAAKSHSADGDICTLKYFAKGTVRAWQQEQAATDAARSPTPAGVPQRPSGLAYRTPEQRRDDAARELERERRDLTRRREYDAVVAGTIATWIAENSDRHAEIVAAVKRDLPSGGQEGFGKMVLEQTIAARCASEAGVPTFENAIDP